MIEELKDKFTKYEIARILGARALQLSMDAPPLLKMNKEELEKLDFNSLKIAEKELLEDVLPITIKRPFPKKAEKTIKKLTPEEIAKKLEKEREKEKTEEKTGDNEIGEKEEDEEKEIEHEGEIMEMATPVDEQEEEVSEESEEG